jgi:nitronate monooxygenase
VARGAEGGGHGQPSIGTLALLEAVLDAVDVPVLAAGGITTGRGSAAVLAAGASGVWLGTAFAACPESLISDRARQVLLAASGADTVVTRAFDIALGYPWPAQYPERVLRNDFTDRWSGHEAQLALDHDAHAALAAGIADGDVALAPVNAGQGVGSLVEVHRAARVIQQLCADASALLRPWPR